MKSLLTATLPALAALALSSCAGTSALTTSESDGVYYSSKDRTTAVTSTAPASTEPSSAGSTGSNEAVNPDYSGSSRSNGSTSNNPDYYDNGYSSRAYRQPYAGPSVVYYSPPVVFAPAVTYSSFSYGWGGGFCGFSPYGYYDPFYAPLAYGYGGPGVSISVGYGWGRPYYGGYYSYGRPYYGSYYDPFGYGYGYGGYYGYSPYSYYGGGYYGLGGRGYYGTTRNVIYTGNDNNYGGGRSNPVLVGPRRSRGGDIVTGGRSSTPNSPTTVPTGRGRTQQQVPGGDLGGRAYNGNGTVSSYDNTTAQPQVIGGRGRTAGTSNPVAQPGTSGPDRMNTPQPISNPTVTEGGRGRWRSMEAQPGYSQPASQPTYSQPVEQPQPVQQPEVGRGRQSGGYISSGEQQPARSYERPQRTYESQPSRSYEQPQRTYSAPSYGGGSSGGGSYGGGNSGGGSGGRRGR